jgi:hypothetical protein
VQNRCGYQGCFDGWQFFGIILLIIAMPLTLMPLGLWAQVST